MVDRALQSRVVNALEREREARFEPKTYGFRPGRGCQDAIAAIYQMVKGKKPHRVWALDADPAAAFDRIDHAQLLAALGSFPAREQIRQWPTAGVIDKGRFAPTEEDTPQGGVILLDRTLLWNESHLRRCLHEFELDYNQHRPHQAIHQTTPPRAVPPPITDPDRIAHLNIRRSDRLGRIIHEHQHAVNCTDVIIGRHNAIIDAEVNPCVRNMFPGSSSVWTSACTTTSSSPQR